MVKGGWMRRDLHHKTDHVILMMGWWKDDISWRRKRDFGKVGDEVWLW